LAWRSQLPWLEITGDWFEDDPAVALHEVEPELPELELAAELDAAAVVLAWWAAMPPPRPRKTAALSTPAASRDRAAGWRRRRGRRVPLRARRAAACIGGDTGRASGDRPGDCAGWALPRRDPGFVASLLIDVCLP